MITTIKLQLERLRNTSQQIYLAGYKFFRKRWKRNAFTLFLFLTFFVLGFLANAAWATEAKQVSLKPVPTVPTTTTSTTTSTTTTTTVAPTTTVPQPVATQPPAPLAPQGDIQQYIHDQAVAVGLDPSRMLRIAKCESGFDPNAVNHNYYAGGGNPSGIYQYLPETWNRISSRSGLGVGSVFDWQLNVRVTMWAYVNGYAGEWACK